MKNKITEQDIKEYLNKEEQGSICLICHKKFKRRHNAQKYCSKKCSHIAFSIQQSKQQSKFKKPRTEKQKQQMLIRQKLKSNIINPSCSYTQGNSCMKNIIKFDGFTFNPSGLKCRFNPRDKCPSFKPRHPNIYNFIKKNKLNKLRRSK